MIRKDGVSSKFMAHCYAGLSARLLTCVGKYLVVAGPCCGVRCPLLDLKGSSVFEVSPTKGAKSLNELALFTSTGMNSNDVRN